MRVILHNSSLPEIWNETFWLPYPWHGCKNLGTAYEFSTRPADSYYFTRRLTVMSHSIVFLTRRLVFFTCKLTIMSCRIVFVTRRVQKRSYIKFSKSLIFVSSSQSPTGILFPQLTHLCCIGVLWSIRVGNYMRSSFRLGECDFANVALIVDYVYPYSYDDSMCVSWRLSYASIS